MTLREKQHKMALIARDFAGSLVDVSDLTDGQARALRFALDLIERHVVTDDFNDETANADLRRAADILEWCNTDVPGDCPLVS